MVRDNIVAIVAASANPVGERAVTEGLPEREVALAVMRDCRTNWLAPSEDEAFMASVATLIRVLPERKELLMEEARSIGDASKMLNALMNGIPVDLEAWEPTPVPEGALGLTKIWAETA